MSVSQKVQIIIDGLFDKDYPPDQMQQVLSIGMQQVVNWPRLRPAIIALDEMPWYGLDAPWRHFLDDAQYPTDRPMKLQNNEVALFQELVRSLKQGTQESVRVLRSVHPLVPATDFAVSFEARDFASLKEITEHIHDVVKHVAVDEPIKIRAVQTGSIEIAVEAIQLTGQALALAILLVQAWKQEPIDKLIRLLERIQRKNAQNPDPDKEIRESVIEDAREEFWRKNDKLLVPGLNPKAVNTAADLIYEHSDKLGVRWSLPPAVIRMLPDGVEIDIHSTKYLETALKALSEPKGQKENH